MNENTLWILLTVVGVAGALAVGVVLRMLNTRIRSVYGKFQAPQLSFRYDAHDVCTVVEILKEKGVAVLFDRFCLLMAAMMAEVLMILMVVAHNITDLVWLQYIMFGLSGVIWLTGTLETLIPVFIVIMIILGVMGIVGIAILAALLLSEIVLLIATRERTPLHDIMSGTVAVDMASQMIFNSTEELLAYKQRAHAKKVNDQREHAAEQ